MSYDAIVIGTGAVGSAALWALARRGLRVLGLDRFPPGHDQGSSHGETRVIRQAYFEHEDYVPLLRRSYRLWSELEAAVSRELFIPTGLVQVGAPDGEVVTGALRAAARHGLAVESLSSDEVQTRFPMLKVPEGSVAVYESTGGVLRVEDCVRSLIQEAVRLGAEHRVEALKSWRAVGEGVEVETRAGTYQAGRLLIAGGAWASQLLSSVPGAPALYVLRKPLYWYGGAAPTWAASKGAPVFLYDSPAGIFYGFPSFEPGVLKVAEHTGGARVADPLQVDRTEWASETARVSDFVARSLVGVRGPVSRHAVCMYTMSPDQHFIVDRHPEHRSVVYAAGLSGHGFKMATVLGEALAELAFDGRSQHPIEFLSADRFSAS
jgi:sarcosine oxidase